MFAGDKMTKVAAEKKVTLSLKAVDHETVKLLNNKSATSFIGAEAGNANTTGFARNPMRNITAKISRVCLHS